MTRIRQAIILCAGRGGRINNTYPKVLRFVSGLSFLERHLYGLAQYGVNDFIIVTGYNNNLIESFIHRKQLNHKYHLQLQFSPDWNKKENVYSVYVTKNLMKHPFFVVMGDHLFDYSFLENFKFESQEKMVIFVDSNPLYFDPAHSTKVVMDETDRIFRVSKYLKSYQATEIGLAYCPLTLFKTLEECIKLNQTNWNDTQDLHARSSFVYGFDIKGAFWTNNNTQADFKKSREYFSDVIQPNSSY